MTHQPPPTKEQFELLEGLMRSFYENSSVVGGYGETRASALRAVLAYARLGVETARGNEGADMPVNN